MIKSRPQSAALSETKRVGKFGLVGVINTLIDFSVYNLMFAVVGLPVIPSNLISTSVAMSFSFVANKTFVFGRRGGHILRQALLFIIITAFGLYVLQNSVIYIFKFLWPEPLEIGHRVLARLGLDFLSQEFVVNNGAKALATLVSMTWNYLMYKRFVFNR
ncbi:GtrA family protein [Candidatus Microgenomates bacterium]|nr:GtrA family protein [Candidatus Microgenomates bacterium]